LTWIIKPALAGEHMTKRMKHIESAPTPLPHNDMGKAQANALAFFSIIAVHPLPCAARIDESPCKNSISLERRISIHAADPRKEEPGMAKWMCPGYLVKAMHNQDYAEMISNNKIAQAYYHVC